MGRVLEDVREQPINMSGSFLNAILKTESSLQRSVKLSVTSRRSCVMWPWTLKMRWLLLPLPPLWKKAMSFLMVRWSPLEMNASAARRPSSSRLSLVSWMIVLPWWTAHKYQAPIFFWLCPIANLFRPIHKYVLAPIMKLSFSDSMVGGTSCQTIRQNAFPK